MKLKSHSFASLICVSLLGSASLSYAEVLVSEDFSYADGGLAGQNGGTGFGSNVWFDTSTNVTGGVAGGTGDSHAKRNFSASLGTTGTLWVRFDWGNSDAPAEWNSYGGLTFYNGASDGGSESFLIGNPWAYAPTQTRWNISSGSGSPNSTVDNHPGLKSGVAKLDLDTGTVSLWVGTPGTTIDVSTAAHATTTGVNLTNIQGIRINGWSGNSASQSFDNLLIATHMVDVNAIDGPPSPPNSGTWANTADGSWDTATNWTSDIVANGNDGSADFNTLNITADTTVNLATPRTIGNLIFGDTDTSSAAGWTLTNDGTPDNILILVGTAPTITVNALGENKTATIGATIAGTAGLAKSGTGTLTLSGPNTFSGATTINGGTVQVNGQRYFNIGRTTTVASGAVLELIDSNNTFTSLMPVSSISGAGTFRLSGNSTINQELNGTVSERLTFAMDAGGLIDLQGTSRLTNGGWKQMNWTNNNASLNVASGATFDIWDGLEVRIDALTGSGTVLKGHPDPNTFILTLGVVNGSGTFSGTIQNTSGTGAIALTKTGTGSQTLSGTNTYNGNTTVNDGTLNIEPSGSLRFFPTNAGQSNYLSGSETATLSYLGTVDIDLSAAETGDGNIWFLIDVASFTGPVPTLSPAAVTSTLGAFTEISPGIWELAVTGAKWTFAEDDGTLIYTVTATDYELWANSFSPSLGLPADDDDDDGLTNFEEYAFGLLPNNGSSVNPISVPLDKTAGTFSYTRRSGSDLVYSVWFSENLADWTEDTGALEGAPVPNGDNESVEITLSNLPGNPLPAKLFIQVRAN